MHTHLSTDLFERFWAVKWSFFGVFGLVVFVTYLAAWFVEMTPEQYTVPVRAAVVSAESEPVVQTEVETVPVVEEISEPVATVAALPERVIFDALDKEIEILNPVATDIATLDAALLEGAVRHPQSADFIDVGNIFIFGHSSYLPSVHNRNYQAFNGIQKLEWGDTVRLQSADREYTYRVDRVYKAEASNAEINNQRGVATLTLVTCNSFGSTDDRFIVEATLVGERVL